MQNSAYSQDFKDQITKKVLNRLEKNYLTSGGKISEDELNAYRRSQDAGAQAWHTKLLLGSLALSFGFITSRVPLTGAATA